MECKSGLRGAVLSRRDRLSPTEIRRQSAAAGSRLFALPEFAGARTVMFFVSFGSEVDTVPMIERAISQGKRVVAPRADPESRSLAACEIGDPGRDTAPGAHGIREPKSQCPAVDPESIDVVVVPAVVWGEDGYRLGYGGGYYDRFLRRATRAVRVGLGMEMQVVGEVPHCGHDLPVDVLVTEAGVRRFGRRGGREEEAAQDEAG
jgi:5-formyltetrahydrofolate cyclo-ligase